MIELLNIDCMEYMATCKDKQFDLAIVDPPYGSSGRDGSVHLEKDDVLGNRMSSDSFIWFIRQYSKQLYRITKDNIHCYVFSDWRKFKDVQIAFETNGWELRALIVWNKSNGMGEYWRSAHEFILFFTKRKPKKLTHGGCMNVLNFKPVRGNNKLHSCEKPIELIKYLIEASSKEADVIIDPFMGSATTAMACAALNRNFVGCEIDKEYYEAAKRRFDVHKMQQKLF